MSTDQFTLPAIAYFLFAANARPPRVRSKGAHVRSAAARAFLMGMSA